MNAKERALQLFQEHIALATTDGRLFRKTIIDTLMAEFAGMQISSAATHYNNAKKASAPVDGLGRAPVAKGVRRPGARDKKEEVMQDDDECFSVIELTGQTGNETVGRCRSFLMQGDASEYFDTKVECWPNSVWVLIQGLGPISGENYRLSDGEQEIKRHAPQQVAATA